MALHDVHAQTGHLNLARVDGAVGWDGSARPVQAQQGAPSRGTARFVLKDLLAGDHAVTVNHDDNDNGKLDTNLVGTPLEGHGFSKNPNVMRKPTFAEARFAAISHLGDAYERSGEIVRCAVRHGDTDEALSPFKNAMGVDAAHASAGISSLRQLD